MCIFCQSETRKTPKHKWDDLNKKNWVEFCEKSRTWTVCKISLMLPVCSKSVQYFSNAVEWKYRVEHLNGCIKDVLSARWESFLLSERKERRRDICRWYSGFCSEEKLCNLNNLMKGQVFTAVALKPKERGGEVNGSPWGTRGKIKAPRGYSSDQNVSHPSVRAGLDEGQQALFA